MASIRYRLNEVAVQPVLSDDGKFKIIDTGAFARVIEVTSNGKLCAAKEIHPLLVEACAREEEFSTVQKRFMDECYLNSRISHPYMVPMLGVHYRPEAKLPWLVMHMMETSLNSFLKKSDKDKVSLHTKLSILINVSQGLEFLHTKGIMHRDLSSNNILLTKNCIAKIADLGVAKVIDNKLRNLTTQPGTLCFMPPEALVANPQYDLSIDIFSLGCVTCHVISHQWPEPLDLVPIGSLTALTQVQRRVEYLQLFTLSCLRQLTESCLDDSPGQRPKIEYVFEKFTDLKNCLNKGIILCQVTADREIRKGTFGKLIKAIVHGTVCVAKEVDPTLTEKISLIKFEAMKHSFIIECDKAIRIHHPNIVQVLGIHYPFPGARLPWLVMEKMQKNLSRFINRFVNRGIPLYFKYSILADISQALQFLHGQNIVNGHLTSNKILLTEHCVAKISYVGVGKYVEHSLTNQPGVSPFMPPEATSVEPRSKPVDVFSLACIALHVMSQENPESLGDTPTEMQQGRKKCLESFTEPLLKKLLESCLDNSPEKRPDVSHVCKELKALKDESKEQLPSAISQSSFGFVDLVNFVHSNMGELQKHLSAAAFLLSQKEDDLKQLSLKDVNKQNEVPDFKPIGTLRIDFPFQTSHDGSTGLQFVWKDYGFKAYLPASSSQPLVETAVSSCLPFNSQLHPGVHIVSSIYHLQANVKRFDAAVTLQLQHCVNLKSEDDCQKMFIVIQQDSVTTCVDGNFNIGDPCGTIETNSLGFIYVVWKAERDLPLNVQQENIIQEQLASSVALSIIPPYVYEEILVLPKDRFSESWIGWYLILPKLDGLKLNYIKLIKEDEIVHGPADIFTSEIEFDDSAVATLAFEISSGDEWAIQCSPCEIKKSMVDQEYAKFRDLANYDRWSRVQRINIFFEKNGERLPLRCRLMVKGIKQPHDINLLPK